MLNLREYRPQASCLADFLPWAALIAPGVILNKDGSFQRSAKFRGPDLDSATPAELVATTARLNNALRRLGSGWALFFEAQRVPAIDYPQSDFPDPVSALIDRERREQFAEEGAHFESFYYLTLLWMPPAEDAARAETLLYEGHAKKGVDAWELLKGFTDRSDRLLHLVEGFVPEVHWLGDGETLTYLHSTVSTKRQNVRVPEIPMHLDALLVDEPLTGGLEPRLGQHHLRTLTITGFPSITFPGLLDEHNRLAIPYRWSTRPSLHQRAQPRWAFGIVGFELGRIDPEPLAQILPDQRLTLSLGAATEAGEVIQFDPVEVVLGLGIDHPEHGVGVGPTGDVRNAPIIADDFGAIGGGICCGAEKKREGAVGCKAAHRRFSS